MDEQPIKVRIQYGAQGSTVEIDGQRIPHLTNIRIEHLVGHRPTLHLEFSPRCGVEIEGWATVNGSLMCPVCGENCAEVNAQMVAMRRIETV
jgi:hypothetical protein